MLQAVAGEGGSADDQAALKAASIPSFEGESITIEFSSGEPMPFVLGGQSGSGLPKILAVCGGSQEPRDCRKY